MAAARLRLISCAGSASCTGVCGDKAKGALGNKPSVLALNKADLVDQWALSDDAIAQATDDFTVFRTSAKTGENVEPLFHALAEAML